MKNTPENELKEELLFDEIPAFPDPEPDTEDRFAELGYSRAPKKETEKSQKQRLSEMLALSKKTQTQDPKTQPPQVARAAAVVDRPAPIVRPAPPVVSRPEPVAVATAAMLNPPVKKRRSSSPAMSDLAAIKRIDKILNSLAPEDKNRVMDFVGGKYFSGALWAGRLAQKL